MIDEYYLVLSWTIESQLDFVMCGEHLAKEKPLILEKIYADFSLLVMYVFQ